MTLCSEHLPAFRTKGLSALIVKGKKNSGAKNSFFAVNIEGEAPCVELIHTSKTFHI